MYDSSVPCSSTTRVDIGAIAELDCELEERFPLKRLEMLDQKEPRVAFGLAMIPGVSSQ